MFNDLERLLVNLPQGFDIHKYQIIFIPENWSSKNDPNIWYRPVDAISFEKALRAQNVSIAGPVEMSLRSEYLDRRSSDIWLGAFWILEKMVIPFVITVLANQFLKAINEPRAEETNKETEVIHTTIYFDQKNVSKVNFEGDPRALIEIMKAIGVMDAENRP